MNFFKNLLKHWHWLIAFLLVPYAVLVWCQAPSHYYDQPDCTEYHSEVSRYEVIVPATDETPEKTQTKHNKKDELKAALECSGLQSQWVMADLTHYAFFAGLAGIILVLFTWISTRKGVRVSETIGQKQTRAYLSVNKVEVDTNLIVNLRIFLKNSGNSPARNIRIESVSCRATFNVFNQEGFVETKWFTDSIQKRYVADIESGFTKEFEVFFGYNGSSFNDMLDMPPQNLSLFTACFVLLYTDVFNETHIVPVSLLSNSFEFPDENLIVLDQQAITLTVDRIHEQAKDHKDNKAGDVMNKIANKSKHQPAPDETDS